MEGPFAGQQYFSREAAERETKKAGKRMPTEEEWLGIIKTLDPEMEITHGGWWKSKGGAAEALGLQL